MNARESAIHRCASIAVSAAAVRIVSAAAIFAAFICALLFRGGAHFTIVSGLAIVWMAVIVAAAGDRLLKWFAVPSNVNTGAMVVIVGTAASSIFVVLMYFAFGILALKAFLLWSALVVGAMAFDRGARQPASCGRAAALDTLAFAALAVLVAIWSRSQTGALPTLMSAGHLPTWSDSYLHANSIAQFGSPFLRDVGNFYLAGEPVVFYHYGFLALSAVAAGFLDFPSLGLATAMLMPAGLLLLVLGSHQLATVLSSRIVGLIVAAAIMFLPDASTYGLANGFFGFHWMVFTSPGNGYAIGIVLAATALLCARNGIGERGCLVLAGAMIVSAFEFRAHIFALFAPAIVASLFFESDRVWRYRGRAALYLAGAGAAALAVLISVPMLRAWWLGYSALQPFLHYIHVGQSPTGYEGVYLHWTEAYGTAIATIAGVLLVPFLAAGLLLPLFAILLPVAVRRAGWRPFDTFPIFLLLCYLGIVLFAPTPFTGDFTELKQRPFVLLYAVFLIWCVILAARILPCQALATIGRPATAIVVLCVAGVLGYWGSASPGTPRFAWGKSYFDVQVNPDLIAAGTYIRSHRSFGEVFSVIPQNPDADLQDPATQVSSVTDLPAYLARPAIHRLWGEPWRGVAQSRLEQMDRLLKMTSFEEAQALMARLKISWLVVVASDQPAFDRNHTQAEFQSGVTTVYHVVTPETRPGG